jgi:Tfp pilus assembly protein FimT
MGGIGPAVTQVREGLQLRTTRESGFTMLELCVVCVVMGIVFAMCIPAYGSYKKSMLKWQVREQLMQDLRGARQTAITRHTPVAVVFGNGSTTTNLTYYTIHNDVNGDGVVQSTELRFLRKLPNGAKLNSVTMTPTDSVTFDISGMLKSGSGGKIVYSTSSSTDTLMVSIAGMIYRP